MSEQVSLRDFFDEKFNALDGKVDAILAQVTATNGRLRKAEIAIAILQWAYGIGAAVAAAWFFNLIGHAK